MATAKRILVADDNQADRMLLASIVRQQGYEVITAVDGADALEQFERGAPELVLLDAMMPGIDGLEVARRIKAGSPEGFIPIIFLTSLTQAPELARCLDAGGDDFLSKPYNKVLLRAKINAFTRMRRMHLTLRAQRDEIRRHNDRLLQEQDAAKQIFDRIAHPGCLDAENISYTISPVAVFNGDVLLAARSPAGNMHVLLGDFTGHGLPASIGAMPLAEIFYGMTAKGYRISNILHECNRKLREILPVDYFCCAAMASLDFIKGTVEIWNGGLPDIYICRDSGRRLERIPSRHLPLGLREQNRFEVQPSLYELEPGERILMYTDGVVEARNHDGEMFGAHGVEAGLRSGPRGIGEIRRRLFQHMSGDSREDDYAIVEITMVPNGAVSVPLPSYDSEVQAGPKDWCLTYRVAGRSIVDFAPLPLVQRVLIEVPELRARGGEICAVLSELYSNALDHGVMGLSSANKGSPEGFAEYYRRRAEALAELDSGYIELSFRSRASENGGYLKIRVTDSGNGFDHHRYNGGGSAVDQRLYGRGLELLRKLCDGLRYRGRGNDVEVSFYWGKARGESARQETG